MAFFLHDYWIKQQIRESGESFVRTSGNGVTDHEQQMRKKGSSAQYWEDISIGASFLSEKRRIAEDEIYQFASLSEDYLPLCLDEEFAKHTIYGQRIVNGLLSLSKIIGMSHALGGLTETSLGLVEMNWKFIKPLFIGDEYYFECIVEEKRLSPERSAGILHQLMIVRNELGEVVQQGQLVHLIRRRAGIDELAGRDE